MCSIYVCPKIRAWKKAGGVLLVNQSWIHIDRSWTVCSILSYAFWFSVPLNCLHKVWKVVAWACLYFFKLILLLSLVTFDLLERGTKILSVTITLFFLHCINCRRFTQAAHLHEDCRTVRPVSILSPYTGRVCPRSITFGFTDTVWRHWYSEYSSTCLQSIWSKGFLKIMLP